MRNVAANLRQSISGYAVRWALKLPVAPPNLAADGCGVEHGELFSQSVAEHAYSLSRRVGDAGWPWVLASIGRSAPLVGACLEMLDELLRAWDGMPRRWPSLTDMGIDVLLISCEVRPKWINSFTPVRPRVSNFSLRKYSTAFTSWLVTDSISLMRLRQQSRSPCRWRGGRETGRGLPPTAGAEVSRRGR